jgi:hypothetical protein
MMAGPAVRHTIEIESALGYELPANCVNYLARDTSVAFL